MKINQGAVERTLRVIAGLVFIWIALYSRLSPTWIWGLAIVGLVLIVTGLSGYCPIWQLLKIDTSKK